ncbi:hypothetical protein TNCV_3094001 [Trichonephila clavipes]|nr:hypothetical protein TNCV_3094001 [Trichonephila clavipes]
MFLFVLFSNDRSPTSESFSLPPLMLIRAFLELKCSTKTERSWQTFRDKGQIESEMIDWGKLVGGHDGKLVVDIVESSV